MGMFDTIKVETKLPTNKFIQKFLGKDFDLSSLEYQTKDLQNALLTYTIKKNGDLFVETIEYRESTPEEQKQDIKKYGKQWGSSRFKIKSRTWQKTDHTGEISFLAYEKLKQDKNYLEKKRCQVVLKNNTISWQRWPTIHRLLRK